MNAASFREQQLTLAPFRASSRLMVAKPAAAMRQSGSSAHAADMAGGSDVLLIRSIRQWRKSIVYTFADAVTSLTWSMTKHVRI